MKNKFRLEGRRALITGAAGGIGSAVARVMHTLGADLVLVDRTAPDTLARALGAEAFTCDVTDREMISQLGARVGAVDTLVINAGIAPFDDWTDDSWDRAFHEVMKVNVLGAINVARVFLPKMIERGNGRIVLSGSIAAYTGGGIFDTPPHYVASKGALHTLMRWLAQRGGADVAVNAVAPGVIATPLTEGLDYEAPSTQLIPRMGTAKEVAWPVAFLCSDAASYITGAILDINGGSYLRA